MFIVCGIIPMKFNDGLSSHSYMNSVRLAIFASQLSYALLFCFHIQVRNKLDRCLYAIKRIKLNPKSKMLNRRITREVKLLSRLNHENVVRRVVLFSFMHFYKNKMYCTLVIFCLPLGVVFILSSMQSEAETIFCFEGTSAGYPGVPSGRLVNW